MVAVEHRTDVVVLRDALGALGAADREILLDRHLHGRTMATIAERRGAHPQAVRPQLRRAEERLSEALAGAYAVHGDEPACRSARATMHDYLAGRLLPHRQQRLEVHMAGCTECTRAFVDVRDVSWTLHELGWYAVADGGTARTTGHTTTDRADSGGRSGRRETAVTAVAASMLAAVALVGASSYLADGSGEPAGQVLESAGAASASKDAPPPVSQAGTGEAAPPSVEPSNPRPRPSTTPREDGAASPSVRTLPATARATGTPRTGADGEPVAAVANRPAAAASGPAASGAAAGNPAAALSPAGPAVRADLPAVFAVSTAERLLGAAVVAAGAAADPAGAVQERITVSKDTPASSDD